MECLKFYFCFEPHGFHQLFVATSCDNLSLIFVLTHWQMSAKYSDKATFYWNKSLNNSTSEEGLLTFLVCATLVIITVLVKAALHCNFAMVRSTLTCTRYAKRVQEWQGWSQSCHIKYRAHNEVNNFMEIWRQLESWLIREPKTLGAKPMTHHFIHFQ